MAVFLLGNYTLPFPLIELNTLDYTHTHRTAWHTTWKERMHLRVCAPGVHPTTLRIANDNEVRSHG